MVRPASYCNHQGKDHKTEDNEDLYAAEPEFELSKESNAEIVDGDDCDEEDGDI